MFEPLSDVVLLKRQQADEKTEGGLYKPIVAQQNSCMATVVAVGPGRILENGEQVMPDVKVDDVVLIDRYENNEIEVNGEKLIVVRESAILARVV